MSTTKSAGSTRLGRDSQPKYLGIKLFAGQTAKTGQILIRQRGTKIFPGTNVAMGKDNTLFALKPGIVRFTTKQRNRFDSSKRTSKTIHVMPPQ